jgi:hypothetical protein
MGTVKSVVSKQHFSPDPSLPTPLGTAICGKTGSKPGKTEKGWGKGQPISKPDLGVSHALRSETRRLS